MLNYEYDAEAEAEERVIRQESERKGRLEEKFEVASKLLDKGIALDIIVETTGLSLDEILKLALQESSA